MNKLFGLIIICLFASASISQSYGASGTLFLHLPDLSEKQLDSVAVWFMPGNNIIASGICIENKLLAITLQEKDEKTIQGIFSILKSHGLNNFFVKEGILLDRFYQNCETFISFP